MTIFSSRLIFALSAVELAIGFLKTEVAVLFARTDRGANWIIFFGVLLEAALCVSVNTFSILNARATAGADLEWKLLAVAAALDAALLLLEWILAWIFANLVKGDGYERTRRSCLFSVVTLAGMITLAAPLAAHFLRTTDRAVLLFSSVGEKIASIAAVSISAIPILFFTLVVYSNEYGSATCDPSIFAIGLAFMGPLLASTCLSVYGALTRDKATLLSILLVTSPPSFSLTFLAFKVDLLDKYGKKRERNGAARRQAPTKDPPRP